MVAKQSHRESPEPIVQTGVRIPLSINKQLKIIAIEENKSLNLLLEEIIKDYLKKRKK